MKVVSAFESKEEIKRLQSMGYILIFDLSLAPKKR